MTTDNPGDVISGLRQLYRMHEPSAESVRAA